jgi:hypothetical protein
MWKCPDCGRTFAVKTKEHSCYLYSVDSHFEGRIPVLRKTYDKLVDAVSDFGPVSIQPVKGSIFFKKAGTFASVTVRKDHLKIDFFLSEKYEGFPIEKTLQYTQKKIAHYMSLAKPADVNKQLVSWMKESYSLAK